MGNKKLLYAAGLVLLATGILFSLLFHWDHKSQPVPTQTNPVPLAIRQAVDFPVYYPDPKKLPTGYSLNLSSFSSPVKNGVVYSVSYGNGKKIVFSVQVRPSDNELQSFNSNYIPLRVDYQTPVGQAEIGAYHSQTLVSLPAFNGPWIVITAPPDINQNQLKQVLTALKAPVK